MITPRLTSCTECTEISVLLSEINCKMTEIAKKLYNNITLMLGYTIDQSLMIDLLSYQRILTYKLHNEDYAPDYTIEMISSRIKLLKYK